MMRLLDRLLGRPSCSEVMELLQAYLDGEIDAPQAKAVAKHLDRCSNCGPEAEVYRRLIASIKRQPPEPEPDSVDRLRIFLADLNAE